MRVVCHAPMRVAVKLHEFQAKELLRQGGIPVPEGLAVDSPEGAQGAAQALLDDGASLVAVKAQAHAGGRGKGGGIKLSSDPEEVALLAERMLGQPLVTPQTGPEGVPVHKVLVEAGVAIAREIYLGITLDRAAGRAVVIASGEGGIDIEEVAAATPEAILREWIEPGWGLRAFQARRLASQLELVGKSARAVADIVARLARIFGERDASLAEINPLVVCEDGAVVALDAKIVLDDNALFRHPELAELRDRSQEQPLEVEASASSLSYVALDGNIGCMVNGAGLAMATMDEIHNAGGRPANFLDVGGNASVERVAAAFRILMKAPSLQAVLINIFGGIVRCDRVASGIIEALQRTDVSVPVIVRLQGTNAAEGVEMLRSSELDFAVAETLEEAAASAVGAVEAATADGSR